MTDELWDKPPKQNPNGQTDLPLRMVHVDLKRGDGVMSQDVV